MPLAFRFSERNPELREAKQFDQNYTGNCRVEVQSQSEVQSLLVEIRMVKLSENYEALDAKRPFSTRGKLLSV